jgi:hypothetical protein
VRPNSAFTIPITHDKGFYQTPLLDIYFAGAAAGGFDHYYLNMQPAFNAEQPCFQGKPYTLSNTQVLFQAGFFKNNAWTYEVPATHELKFRAQRALRNAQMLVYENSNHWQRSLLLKTATTADDAHFSVSGNEYTLFPVMGGVFLSTTVTNLSQADINFALSEHVFWDFGRVKLYLDSPHELPQGTILSIHVDAEFPDTRNILRTQYQLQQTSWSYHVQAMDSDYNFLTDFLQNYHPVLFFATSQRSNPILFHLNQESDYRLYAYPQGTTLTGYNFITENNFHSVVPAYNGDYCMFNDLAPHTTVTAEITESTEPLLVSLYQAEFVMPALYNDVEIPVGYKIKLSKLASVPDETNLQNALYLDILDETNHSVDSTFITNVQSSDFAYLYLPFTPETDSTAIHVKFRSIDGETITNYTHVEAFSHNPDFSTQFLIIGNCAILCPDKRGTYYVTQE